MSKETHIHDKVFKLALKNPDQAKDLIENYLPKNVSTILNLDTIRLENDSFVEKKREYFADLLYSVKLKSNKDAFVYVLFEHKSYKDGKVLIQLLKYMVAIWNRCMKRSMKAHLPRIIPFIVYHGKSNWKIPDKLSSMFDKENNLDRYLPDFGPSILNLKNENINKGSNPLKLLLWSLKHSHDKDLINKLFEIYDIFFILSSNVDQSFHLDLNLTYWADLLKLSEDEIINKIKKLFNLGDDKMELISERFRKQGLKQGLVQGRQEGKQEGMSAGILFGIETALEIRFGASAISLMEKISTINNSEKLKSLLKQIKLAKSFESVKKILA